MKLVADLELIKNNLNSLSDVVDNFSDALSSFSEFSINCSIEEISSTIDSYKKSIEDDLNKLNTSSHEFKDLVDDCCNEYKNNEDKVQDISIDVINEILANNKDITFDYQGCAKDKLTGLPSVDFAGFSTGVLNLDGTVVNTNNYVQMGHKYGLSNDELALLAYVALREQGTLGGAKMELSLMANLYEKNKSNYSSVYDYVKNSGWFASNSFAGYSYPGDDYFNAANEVLNEGHLYLPSNVDEHDCLSDISSISTGSSGNRSDYIPGETVVHNRYGSTYVFVGFAPDGGDPFGYTC